jgi:uncharacterized protein
MNEVVELTIASFAKKPQIKKISSDRKSSLLLKNDFVKKQISNFDKNIQNIYVAGITAIAPFGLIYETEILKSLIKNPAIEWIDSEKLKEIIDRNLTLLQLEQGLEIGEKHDTLLLKLGVDEQALSNMRSAKNLGTLKCKNGLKKIDGINQTVFNNISGFVIFPKSTVILEKTLVHPIMFNLAEAMCDTLKTTIEDMVRSKELISFYKSNNPVNEFFICEKVANHLNVGAKYISLANGSHHRTPWHEITPGTITYGKVRNITDFGIFVDINAATDGLIHISEVPYNLAYSIEKVMSPGEKVRVKILDVDSKKRKIALSMNYQNVEINELLGYFNENL